MPATEWSPQDELIILVYLSIIFYCGGPVDVCMWHLVICVLLCTLWEEENLERQRLRHVFPILV